MYELTHKDLPSLIGRLIDKMMMDGYYKPDAINDATDFIYELKASLKFLLDELRSGNCDDEIDEYLFLKRLKLKNPMQYSKVLRWNQLAGGVA